MSTTSPPNTKEIQMFMHCGLCIKENKQQRIEAGWTPLGFQVWCRNHDCNIVHVDFEGQTHPANTTLRLPAPVIPIGQKQKQTTWINILSACEQVPQDVLPKIAQQGPKPIFLTTTEGPKIIGQALRYEVRDEVDLWAEVEIYDDCKFKRAAGVLDHNFNLQAVLATNLPREDIRKLSTV